VSLPRIAGLWLTHAGGDGKDHAWNKVVADGRWQARCSEDIVADPATLEIPEDEFGRCVDCERVMLLELGAALGGQARPGQDWHS
jgi:hypothetical protein